LFYGGDNYCDAGGYREGKAGSRSVGDVSRLANVLSLLGRLIEGADFETRIATLESIKPQAKEKSWSQRH
jgi:hypothetical protein